MRKNILLFILLVSVSGYSQNIKKALFIGNSYTAANDLPFVINKLAISVGDSLNYESSTAGGQTLQGHSTSAATISSIQTTNWDYVVLQEQSQLPSFPMSQVQIQVFPYAKALCDTIRYFNGCTTPLFFMTWGRENGDQNNCANWPPICTYNGMDSLLNLRYRMMADSNGALVSPVGAVWHYIRDNYPDINLYSSDGSHPSMQGTYAAACTFYALIFQNSPILIQEDYGLNHDDAIAIRDAARIIAFDSLSKWNVGKFNPQAIFTVADSIGVVHTFNNSKYADTYLWDFGDGTTSTLFEPTHSYTTPALYTVSLEATRCDNKMTADTTLLVSIENIELPIAKTINIYPNPVIGGFILSSEKVINAQKITLYSADGRVVKRFNSFLATEHKFDIKEFKDGIYFLSMLVDGEYVRIKIVKQ